MKTINITTSTTILLIIIISLQQLAAARDTPRHDMPTLKGATQHAQLISNANDYWSQFTNAINIKNNNLNPAIAAATPEDDIIIYEAYAEWCGFCQQMAPKFDGTAKHFNNVGGLVLAKGTCDNNAQLCDDLGVRAFPSFYYGDRGDFENISASGPPAELDDLRSMSSATEMITFLSGRFGIDSDIAPDNDNDDDAPANGVNETTAPLFTISVDAYLTDIEKSTSDSLTQALVSTSLLEQTGSRDAFYDWQTWISDSHPSEKCRMGADDILNELDDIWPVANYNPATVRANLMKKNQCLADYGDVEYQGCAVGGNAGVYTCGLWQTFHAMSVSPNSLLTGEQMFEYLGQFIKYFFTCTVCQEHFLGMMAKVDPATVHTQDGFVIWLWEAHNEVNERLREEELDNGLFNVDRPKGLFPSPELCAKCLEDREGNYIGPYLGEHSHISPFLDDFYSEELVVGVHGLEAIYVSRRKSIDRKAMKETASSSAYTSSGSLTAVVKSALAVSLSFTLFMM